MKTKMPIMPEETLDSRNEIRLVYNIAYFYGKFLQKYRYLDSLEGKRKKDKKLTYRQYRLIVKTYLKIYFYEVFYIDRPLYFCLTGKLMRVRTTAFTMNNTKLSPSITVIWYLKYLQTLDYLCTIKLMNGSTSLIAKIRKQWKNENDLGMLPMISVKKKEFKDKNLMYQHHDKRSIFFQSDN